MLTCEMVCDNRFFIYNQFCYPFFIFLYIIKTLVIVIIIIIIIIIITTDRLPSIAFMLLSLALSKLFSTIY